MIHLSDLTPSHLAYSDRKSADPPPPIQIYFILRLQILHSLSLFLFHSLLASANFYSVLRGAGAHERSRKRDIYARNEVQSTRTAELSSPALCPLHFSKHNVKSCFFVFCILERVSQAQCDIFLRVPATSVPFCQHNVRFACVFRVLQSVSRRSCQGFFLFLARQCVPQG